MTDTGVLTWSEKNKNNKDSIEEKVYFNACCYLKYDIYFVTELNDTSN